MTDTPAAPSRLVASHLRDFAEFLPVEKREDFNATIDDLVDRLATAYEANTALDRALRSDTAPLYPKSENSRDNAPMVPQTIHEKSNATSAGCVIGRIPALESTRINADYWIDAARKAESPAEALMFIEQAANAWKNAAYAAHDKMAAPAAAPSGCVSVPREPTEAMRRAAYDAYRSCENTVSDWSVYVYRAMLAAAPKPKGEGK